MTGQEFFGLAEHLLANLPTRWEEAAERTVTSRIYYAAFIYSRDLMETWGCRFTDAAVHAQVAEGLRASGQLDLVKIGGKLSNLHAERKRADYQTKSREGFDFRKLKELYGDVVNELRGRWQHLNAQQRQEALGKINARIAAY